MKKLSIIMIIAIMVGTLAACGSNNNEVNSSEISKEEVTVNVTETENTDIDEQQTEENETTSEEPIVEENETTEDTSTTDETNETDTTETEKVDVNTISDKSNATNDEGAPVKEWSAEANVSENEDGTLTVDYIITSEDGNATHSFTEKPMFDKSWYEMYKENGIELYKLVDFNFDGYLDIRTQQYGAMVNQFYNI